MNQTSQKIQLMQRRQRALTLRLAGWSYRAIADRIAQDADFDCPKYNHVQALRDVQAMLSEAMQQVQEDAELLRELELLRLDEATRAIAIKVKRGDLKAIDQWVKLSESRRRLLGLDAPIRLEVEQRLQAEISIFLDRLEAMLPHDVFKQVLQAVDAAEARRSAELN